MMKKLDTFLVVLVCLLVVFSFKIVSAETNIDVLIYTNKISVTIDDTTTTFSSPQEIKTVPTNSIIECLDGVAILQYGDTQVVFEAKDKAKLMVDESTQKLDVICLDGEIVAMINEEMYKIARGKNLVQVASEATKTGTVEKADIPSKNDTPTRARLADPPDDLIPTPIQLQHASPSY